MSGPNHNQADDERVAIVECDAREDGFYCTRPAGHVGQHVAHDWNDEVVHNWAQEVSS